MVDPLSRLALEWTPIYPMKRTDVVLDIFKHHISYKDGLPPYAQARIIDLISSRLLKARSYPGLWISVDAPGVWFLNEIRRFVKRKIPIAILPADRNSVAHLDFHEPVRPTYISEEERPVLEHRFDPREYRIKKSALRVLRILARLKAAYRTEIASMAGLSESQTRTLLKKLQMNGLIEQKKTGKYNGWAILNKGVRLAHRSWNIPKGVHFTKHRGEFRYAGERHRRISRLWRAWLEAAYPSIDIWESWTEVPVRYGIPDALAWGHNGKHEILFWLEVDTGHSSKKTMHINYGRRLRLAYEHSREWGTAIVFGILGPRWVVEEFRYCIPRIYPNVAVIGHDWSEFGVLPVYEFGHWREDIEVTQNPRKAQSDGELPFEPTQYPSKLPKKAPKLPKSKSTRPRYLDQSSAGSDSHWSRDRIEE